MRVRGDAPVLWRTTGQTQIGVEPGRSLVLTGLTAAEQQLLDHLPRRMSPDDVYRASRRCRVPLPRAQDLLGRLRAEGVLRGAGSRPTTPGNPSQAVTWQAHGPAGWPEGEPEVSGCTIAWCGLAACL